MKKFIDENFLLDNKTAEFLYHQHAKDLPVIDYHCHLPPQQIADDKIFENITQAWLYGDHYKWRAMRANGIPEKYITGNVPDVEKFQKWADTVPFTLRNPLYHWTHLELLRYFKIDRLLDSKSAMEIFESSSKKLRSPEYSIRNLLRMMKVEVVCTTDDPVDSLVYHKKIRKDGLEIKIIPAWRPDNAMAVNNPESYNNYLDTLASVSDTDIRDYNTFVTAIQKRHDYFNEHGCKLSDHGIETFYAEDFNDSEIRNIFTKIRSGKVLDEESVFKFKSSMLILFAEMDHDKGWTQQFHIGAIRNINSRMMKMLGPETGYDSIGDFEIARPMSKFFDHLEKNEKLTKTIVYNLNPRDNELIATMIYNFNNSSIPGKMQYGSGWWFLDQKDGIEKQINTISNMGLLSRFVGMLTDSRSFLSYPRHEYFRRILCNILGNDVEKGELPDEPELLAKTVKDICYYNARNYFGFYD
ncbi:MAG: glucuronate isomerase [Bacteroides sp. SM23_62_1]|nr:MAG: glucuronate isomerase [Bacteroides sp. SM23_62_1]